MSTALKRWWMDATWRLRLTLPRLWRRWFGRKRRAMTSVDWDGLLSLVEKYSTPAVRASLFGTSPLYTRFKGREVRARERFEHDA